MSDSLTIVSHPLVNAKLSVLRNAETTPKEFREGIRQISMVLGIEASRDLPMEEFQGQTPVAPFVGTTIKPRIGLTPILRAGLGMCEAMLELFPAAHVYYLGLFREKVTLQPVEYYSKLPKQPTVDLVYLLDPLIATGGTAVAAINMLIDWGISIKDIRFLAVLASRQGIDHVRGEFPDLQIFVAAIDQQLTDKGYITPGLGDTGDRLNNTFQF